MFALLMPLKTDFIEMLTISMGITDTKEEDATLSETKDEAHFYELLEAQKDLKPTQISFATRTDYDNLDFAEYKRINYSMELGALEGLPKSEAKMLQEGGQADDEMAEGGKVEAMDDKVEIPELKKEIKMKELPPSLRYSYQQAILTCEMYRLLNILSSSLTALSHGTNDVANAISPLIILMRHQGQPSYVTFLIGATGIALGLLISGKKVMETLGKKLVVLDFQKGFSAEFATAICIIFYSNLGMPLSTTHCAIGAYGGIWIAKHTQIFKKVYWINEDMP
jgi:phosphate/sulfate permease